MMKEIKMATFTVAGVSNNKGTVKVRFCSEFVLRVKNLQKQGDTDINLVELPNPMTKVEACNFLLTREEFKVYASEINEILGKKQLKETVKAPIIKAVKKEVVDQEIEELKELIAA